MEVFVARDVNPAKTERMRALGAKVTLCDGDFDVAKVNARQLAADHPECIFVEDGAEDAIAEGAGTIGFVIEPSGAAGLAAICHHELPGERLATILTGSNIHPRMLAELVDSAR